MAGYNPRTGLAVTPKDGYAATPKPARRSRNSAVVTRTATPDDVKRMGAAGRAYATRINSLVGADVL